MNRALTYDWNGQKDIPMAAPHLSDLEVAGKVRMLLRDQLDHEVICTLARDRIMALSKEVERLSSARDSAASEAAAREIVESIFADLRDRRFLKWLFDKRGEECVIDTFKDGEELRGLDLEVQDEIKAAWVQIIAAHGRQGA